MTMNEERKATWNGCASLARPRLDLSIQMPTKTGKRTQKITGTRC